MYIRVTVRIKHWPPFGSVKIVMQLEVKSFGKPIQKFSKYGSFGQLLAPLWVTKKKNSNNNTGVLKMSSVIENCSFLVVV